MELQLGGRMTAAHQVFDKKETALVVLALTAIEFVAPDDAALIRAHIQRLHLLREMIETAPALGETYQFAGDEHSRDTLLDRLCSYDGYAGELELPTRATLSRTFLVLKIQLLRDFVRAADRQLDRNPEWDQLDRQLRGELAQSVYTEMAEALLMSLISQKALSATVRRRAADQMVAIWDNAQLEIDDFCPLLESAWSARNRINADLGTLLCTSEYMRLVTEDCAPDFLDYFGRANVSPEEVQAFEEFLLDMSYEEICQLRAAMSEHKRTAADREWAEHIIGRPLDCGVVEDLIDPIAIHRSFFRRHRGAQVRRLAGLPGPRYTAESYMMVYLLTHEHG